MSGARSSIIHDESHCEVSIPMAKKTAFVFFTHQFCPVLERRYESLRRACERNGAAFILAQEGTNVPQKWLSDAHFFSFRELRARARAVVGDDIVPGNCHLAALDFFDAHPHFAHYWFVEYDVVFTGDWATLFSAVQDEPADLLAVHVRSAADEPQWFWWDTLEAPNGRLPKEALRAFFPVYRISQAGLRVLARKVAEGWVGHFEALMPTVLREQSLLVSDIGGGGDWTPAARKNRFYTSFSDGKGGLVPLGTMRFRPPHSSPGPIPNFLYHPVKPAAPTVSDYRFFCIQLARYLRAEPRLTARFLLESLRALSRKCFAARNSGKNVSID